MSPIRNKIKHLTPKKKKHTGIMKTAMGILKEELIKYRNESGNDSIDIDLLIKGIDGIYGHNERQQIINAVTYKITPETVRNSFIKDVSAGEQYYNETFGEL